jgi:peptidoglycan/xylan/chitin deacetylase (PgdA/CDA1 family)
MVLEGRRPDRPIACFSSDDGFESNVRLASVLEEFGTTGCFFVNPASIVNRDDAWVADFCRIRLQAQPSRFLQERQLEELLKAGHEIGNHTMTHVVCSETPSDRLASEIELSKQWLESRFGPSLHFAWPYGQVDHCSETAKRLIFEAGHVSASSVVRGAHLLHATPDTTDDVVLCRDQIWGADPIHHTLYFSARNALSPGGAPVDFPGYTLESKSQLAHWSSIDWPEDAVALNGRRDRQASRPAQASVRTFALDGRAERSD